MVEIKQVINKISIYILFLLITLFCAHYFGQINYPKFAHDTQLMTSGYTSFKSFLQMSAQQMVEHFGPGDPASYIKSAMFFSQNGYFLEGFAVLWPPGQALTVLLIFKLFGQLSYPLKMFYLSIAIWSLAFTFVYYSLTRIKNILLKIVISLSPFYFLSFQTWIFGYSLILSENLSLPLFVIGLCYIVRWCQYKKLINLIAASIVFAILAYYRGYFEIFSRIVIIFTLFHLFYITGKTILFKKIQNTNLSYKQILKNITSGSKEIYSAKLRAVIIGLLIFSSLLIPWRIYMFKHFHTIAWQNMAYAWVLFWSKDPQMYGTMNNACLVEPRWCDFLYTYDIKDHHGTLLGAKFYAMATIDTLLLHPIKWYTQKVKYFNGFWFGENSSSPTWSMLLTDYKLLFFQNSIILLAGIVSIFYSLIRWKTLSEEKKDFLTFANLFVFFNFVLFTFFHFEQRYSLYLQLLFIYLPFWLFLGFKKLPDKSQ